MWETRAFYSRSCCLAAVAAWCLAVGSQGQPTSLQALVSETVGLFAPSLPSPSQIPSPAQTSPSQPISPDIDGRFSPQSSSGPSSNGPSSSDGTNAACCAKIQAINFQTNLPVVIADSGGKAITRDRNQLSKICTCSNGLQKGDVNMTAVFRIRGGTNSQLRNKINQFAIDIDDKKWFLGIPKSRKWMLYGQDLDPFGLHNWFGFELARATGEYAIRTQYCELFVVDDGQPLNRDKHYRGIYVAMEKPRQETNRVNISDNNTPSDISGGYMAEFKHGQNPDNLPTINGTISKQQWNVEYPKKENITQPQLQYFNEYLNQFETALYRDKNWRDFADEPNWVNWFLVIELIRNTKHSYHSSPWMYKDAGTGQASKLRLGPLWGNVQGFGTCCGYPVKYFSQAGQGPDNPLSGGNGISSSGWLFRVCLNDFCPVLEGYAAGYGISTWFQELWKDPEWVSRVYGRYQELRAGNWSNSAISTKLVNVKTLIEPAALRTLDRWESALYQPQYFKSKQEAFDTRISSLQTWTFSRLRWLDEAFKQAIDPDRAQLEYPSSFATTPTPIPQQADITSPTATLYVSG